MINNINNSQLTSVHYWLAIKLIPRLSIANKIALVEKYGLAALFQGKDPLNHELKNKLDMNEFALTPKQLSAILQPDWQKIEQIIQKSAQCDSVIIDYHSSDYPQQLKEIYDPPLVIFAKGNIALLQQPQLAIVGSRNATIAGRESAQKFAQVLSKTLVVTSGLALGIDACAHQGVLDNNASTIAVVATGLDIIYPTRHKTLLNNILKNNGLVISEFVPGTSPKPGHFPKRNRVISGLSIGVLVVEASLKSGSLITARSALEQGREVFAIPSSIFNKQAKGCHWLIKQGAKLVETVEDIMEELPNLLPNGLQLALQQKKQPICKKNSKQDLCNDVMLASVGYEVTPVDKVVSRTKLPIDVVLTRLTVLELKGLVHAVPGGYLKL